MDRIGQKLILLGKWPYAKEDKKYSKPKDQINPLSVAGTIARRPDVCYVPPHHASSPEHQIVSHVPHPTWKDCPAIPSNAMEVEPTVWQSCTTIYHQAHDIPADSGRCADGDSELKSSEAYDVAADRRVTPPTRKYGN